MAKDYEALNELTFKTKELHRVIFDKGFEQGFNQGYEQGKGQKWIEEQLKTESEMYAKGLNDAWECAKKIACKETDGGLKIKELREIFGGGGYLSEILRNYSPSEAISKIKEYEEKQKADDEIKVGDEVYLSSLSKSYPRIVLSLYGENDGLGLKARTMLSSGTIDIKPVSEFKKTGRHFDQIAEVLKQLKEGEK